MSLFKISKEFQFGVFNHGKTHTSSQQKRRGELIFRGNKKAGRAIGNKESIKEIESSKHSGFSLAECNSLSLAKLLSGKKRKSFFFLLGSVTIIGHESFPFWSPFSI